MSYELLFWKVIPDVVFINSADVTMPEGKSAGGDAKIISSGFDK